MNFPLPAPKTPLPTRREKLTDDEPPPIRGKPDSKFTAIEASTNFSLFVVV
jgi:hypothetical protein